MSLEAYRESVIDELMYDKEYEYDEESDEERVKSKVEVMSHANAAALADRYRELVERGYHLKSNAWYVADEIRGAKQAG